MFWGCFLGGLQYKLIARIGLRGCGSFLRFNSGWLGLAPLPTQSSGFPVVLDRESECLMRELNNLQLSFSWTEGSSHVSGVSIELQVLFYLSMWKALLLALWTNCAICTSVCVLLFLVQAISKCLPGVRPQAHCSTSTNSLPAATITPKLYCESEYGDYFTTYRS